MNRKLITLCSTPLIALALLVVTVSGGTAQASRPISQTGAVALPAVQATNKLALELLTRLGAGGNLVFSPYSIQTALAMVDQGAAGSTATQLGNVLGTQNSAALAAAEAKLAADLQGSTIVPTNTPAADVPHVLVANGLWVQSGLPLQQPFQTALDRDFGASPQTLDFGSAPEASRQTINSWVAAHTAQLIKNLMPPGSINSQTALVLANAIYLKAHWANPFVTASTTNRSFFTAPGQHLSVPFMTEPSFETGYARADGYQAIELPYVDSSLSMLAVMPAQGTLAQFERTLTPASLGAVVRSLAFRNVELQMPRLRLDLHTSLNEALSALGMPIAFTDGADFSRITHATGLKIHDVEHGAVMKVDEAGTVAAAATGISTTPTAVLGGPTVALSLNHPFLLFLREDDTGAILFAGRVTNPALG
jgi:serpin B